MRRYKILQLTVKTALSIMFVGYCAFIIYWLFTTSFKTTGEIFKPYTTLFPQTFTLSNYNSALTGAGIKMLTPGTDVTKYYGLMLWNSTVISLGTAGLTAFLSLLAGYAFARLTFPLRRFISSLILATYAIPYSLLIIGFYLIALFFGLIDNYLGPIVAMVLVSVPFCILMLQSFIESMPIELEDAAKIDGCSQLGIIFRIVLPLAAPAIVAAAIYAFIRAWNEYLFILVLSTMRETQTASVGIAYLTLEEPYPWGLISAMSVVYTIPALLFFTYLSKWLVRGLATGAVKA